MLGSPIVGHRFGRGGVYPLLVLGGFHGDEPNSVTVCRLLMEELSRETREAAVASCNINWCIVPVVNPDGYEKRTRRNANKVDLNRNFPASNWELGRSNSRMFGGVKPASEPETRAIMRLIERIDPVAIITIHSISRGRHCNNYDGPGRRIAQSMSRENGYPVTATIGYPTPGSFGTWAGIERGCPVITLELPTDRSIQKIWAKNRLALLRGVPRGVRSS